MRRFAGFFAFFAAFRRVAIVSNDVTSNRM